MPPAEDLVEERQPHGAASLRRLQDRARARRILRRLPRRSNASRYPILKYFKATVQRNPGLWSWKAPHVRRAYYIGWITTMLPIPGLQFVVVLALAIAFRANLTVATGLQFVSNPISAAPILFLTYQTGKHALAGAGVLPEGAFASTTSFLFVGGALLGICCAAATDVTHRCWSSLRRRNRN